MAKVRTIIAKAGNGDFKKLVIVFVYRGYYAIQNQRVAFHTPDVLRKTLIWRA